jgi:intracellular septation protein A
VSPARDQPVAFAPASVGAVVRGAGPRLARDAFGPLACFFAGWKLIDLTAGVLIAAAIGVAIYARERRAGRPGMVVRIALALVAVRASVGLASGSARTYLAMEVAVDVLLATVVLWSLNTERPFTSWFTEEVFPLPNEVRASEVWRHAMRFTTAVWGCYFLVRGLIRLLAWLTLSTNGYVLVAALSDAPFLIGLLAWSAYYTTAAFRQNPQWAPLLARVQGGLPPGAIPQLLPKPQQPQPAPDPTRR